jgi:flagellar biosynthesis protein FlhF
MLFKTYIGSDEREVLALAKRELGDEIMILDLRRDHRDRTSSDDGQQVILRVGVNPRSGRIPEHMNGSSRMGISGTADKESKFDRSSVSRQNEDMAELLLLRQQLRSLKAQLRAVRSCPFLEPFDFCFNTLTDAGTPDDVAELLVTRTEEQLVGMGDGGPVVRDDAFAELKRQISYLFYSPPKNQQRSKREVIAVAGPSGAGKTSLIIKMASHPDIYRDRRVGIISTDIFRAGANAGLKSLGEILSVPIIEARQVDDIPRALMNLAKCDVILMDTPGRSPLSKGSLPDLQTQLAVLRPTETLLVLSANMALEELWLFKGLYQGIHPSGLVITKLDETSKPGKVLALADDPELPMKFVTTGQAVPQSLSIRIPPAVINRLPLATESVS